MRSSPIGDRQVALHAPGRCAEKKTVGSAFQIGETAETDAWGIEPAGGDTAPPENLRNWLALIEAHAGPLGLGRVFDCGCGEGESVRALAASQPMVAVRPELDA